MLDMDKYVSRRYLKEKFRSIERLEGIINNEGDSDCLRDDISATLRQDVAFAFAVVAKELGVEIPTDV